MASAEPVKIGNWTVLDEAIYWPQPDDDDHIAQFDGTLADGIPNEPWTEV